MGSGKSTLALQIHHNLTSRGLRGILCSQLDRADGKVSSALGVSADAVDSRSLVLVLVDEKAHSYRAMKVEIRNYDRS